VEKGENFFGGSGLDIYEFFSFFFYFFLVEDVGLEIVQSFDFGCEVRFEESDDEFF
jgi:hypothetical protein